MLIIQEFIRLMFKKGGEIKNLFKKIYCLLQLPTFQSVKAMFSNVLHKNTASNIEQVLKTALNKAAAVRPPTTYHSMCY